MTTLRANCFPSGRLKDLIRTGGRFLRTQCSTSLCLFLLLLLRPAVLLSYLQAINTFKFYLIIWEGKNTVLGSRGWLNHVKIERLSCYIVARLTTQLLGVQGHALNENLKRAAGAHKKYNVKMFVFFHSRRSRPKKYYGKKPMCPNYYFNIVWIFWLNSISQPCIYNKCLDRWTLQTLSSSDLHYFSFSVPMKDIRLEILPTRRSKTHLQKPSQNTRSE